ncbi:MAG TPA: chemotaxis protein CheW [Thermoanaerobaculia bacterium]|nr:chemotaxis protein CheW [Thermoanaerobaculia bacterium]
MVDLAKIRKKAKAGGRRAAGGGRVVEVGPEEKLQHFLAEAGKQRFAAAAPVESGADEIELLTFVLGGEQYAIDIENVAEIATTRPVTRVPNADPNTVGIISLRGSVVTLLDLRSKLKQPPAASTKDRRVVIVRDGAGLAGFEVDRVLRPAKIDRAAIEPQPVVHADEQSECIRGVVRGANALTIVLDLSKLLSQR